MPRTVSLREGDPEIIDAACCPRCGGDVRPVEKVRDDDFNTVGYRVRHEDRDTGCTMKEWPIYDPDAVDGDEGLPNGDGEGLSICRTCLTWVQHISHEGFDEEGRGKWAIDDPPRDDDGEIICSLCESRLRRQS